MKSFSAASFASEPADLLAEATAAVQRNPQALFTDFQWFLYRAQNTVYFTAFSKRGFDQEGLIDLIENMVSLAPQLTHGFNGAKPGQPLNMLRVLMAIRTNGWSRAWRFLTETICRYFA